MIIRQIKSGAIFCFTGILLWLSGAQAALPPDAIVLEPETMEITGKGWMVKTNFDGGWFKLWPTGDKCLYGAIPGEGQAAKTLVCPADGRYRVWVRYLDLGKEPRKVSRNSFIVKIIQQPGEAKEKTLDAGIMDLLKTDRGANDPSPAIPNGKEFDVIGKRGSKEALSKWGDSWAAFVWDFMDVELRQGDFQLAIEKTHPRQTERHQRSIDCIIITSNQAYEAQTEDLTPLYVRFDVPAARTNALRFLLRSRRTDGSDFFQHVSWATPFVKPVPPGASSEWIELSKYLKLDKAGRYNRVTFDCFIKERGEMLDADYTVNFSRSPSPDGMVKTLDRKGQGGAVSFLIDLNNREHIRDEIGESAANLARSLATPVIGRYPTQFIFQTSCEVVSVLDQTFKNEMQALRNLGINQIAFPRAAAGRYAREGFTRSRVGFYIWASIEPAPTSTAGACYLNPKREEITRAAEQAEQAARLYPPETEVIRLAGFADEPGFGYLAHVTNCPICRKAFPEYLKAMKVPYATLASEAEALAMEAALAFEAPAVGTARDDAALSGLDAVRPCADTNRPHHFYWSSRFGINTVTEFIRLGTRTAESQHPAWRTTMNFGNLRSTLAGSGLDWFEIFRTKALTFGENEDYLAWSKNFQIRGYPMAVMRAACKTQGYDFGPLAAYPSNNGWELVCGGFSQLGQGAKRIVFFNYGPHYVPSSSPCSELQWVHDATRHLTYAAGAVEDFLYDAKVMPGDVALLLSTTSDIWNYYPEDPGFSNLYGMERNYLYLVLRHLQASVDILAEEDLAAELKNYKLLAVTDSHLRREYAGAIKAWVEQGGALYVGANALAFDEYNQPLGLVEALGIKRGALAVDGNLIPGRPEYELRHRKSLGKVKTGEPFNAIFGTQPLEGGQTVFAADDGRLALAAAAFGKGQVLAGYTFPAMEYIKTSDWDKALPIYSTVKFASGPREYIGKALELAGVAPKARCSNMFLEANLLENGKVVVVALANWSGQEQEATITFRGLGKVQEVKAVRTALKVVEQTEAQLVVAGRFGAGDFLTIRR